MIGSKLPSSFCSKINDYLYKSLIEQIEGFAHNPAQATTALEFIHECQLNQKDFFRYFVKYCDENVRPSKNEKKLNRLADVMMRIIEFYMNERFISMVISSSVKMKMVLSIADIILTIYMKENSFYQLKEQIRKYGLENMIQLITSLVTNRIDPFEEISSLATTALTLDDNGYEEVLDNYSSNGVDFLRLRDITDSEIRLSFILSKLLKFSKIEFFNSIVDKRRNGSSINEKTGIFGQNLVSLMNQFIGERLVTMYEILDKIENGYLDDYLRAQNGSGAMISEGDFNDVLEFKSVKQSSLSKNDISEELMKKIRRKRGYVDFNEGIEFDPYVSV